MLYSRACEGPGHRSDEKDNSKATRRSVRLGPITAIDIWARRCQLSLHTLIDHRYLSPGGLPHGPVHLADNNEFANDNRIVVLGKLGSDLRAQTRGHHTTFVDRNTTASGSPSLTGPLTTCAARCSASRSCPRSTTQTAHVALRAPPGFAPIGFA